MLNTSEKYMHRCIELALLGAGSVAPNPMVGAVLVHEDRIIGEGYHQQYGQAHAEVNCIESVPETDKSLIPSSTLYVSLEPCAHFGKTPPCADRIIKETIQHVVIGCRDPFKEVDGKGIGKLSAAGVKVETGILEQQCRDLNKRFFTYHTQHRPYIILKWAQTGDNKIANDDYSRIFISNEYTNRFVHQWRSEEAAILIGTNTASFDDPALTTRLWKGKDPVRLVIDMDLRLPSSLKLLDGSVRTIVFNARKQEEHYNLLYYQVTPDITIVHQVLNACYQLQIQSVLIEGGARLLQSFIDEGIWDEARVITNNHLLAGMRIEAPLFADARLVNSFSLETDTIRYYKP